MGAHPQRHEQRCQLCGGMCAKVCSADGLLCRDFWEKRLVILS